MALDETDNFGMTLRRRMNYVGRGCLMHFPESPLRLSRGLKQYLYDDVGSEYLDCVSSVSHVGHCHPCVVRAGSQQMGKLSSAYGFLVDKQSQYVAKLVDMLPEPLSVFYFTNSGSEANDLAIRLARNITKAHDVLVVDGSFHGNLQLLTSLSPKYMRHNNIPVPEWVHVVPAPDTFRGKYRDMDEATVTAAYVADFSKVVTAARNRGRKIAAFLFEPLLSAAGMVPFPKDCLKHCFSIVREHGGLCIADEVVVGLGRTGESLWAFQQHDIMPDILVLGKHVGNGFPLGILATKKSIADSVTSFSNSLGGNPVACAVGLSVLEVMQKEQLQQAAKYVGRCLLNGLRGLQASHQCIGRVSGSGLAIGVDIVTDPESRKPARNMASMISQRLRMEKIILAPEGPERNVLIITPPMCFTCENARRLVACLDAIVTDLERNCTELAERTSNMSMIMVIGSEDGEAEHTEEVSAEKVALMLRNTVGSDDLRASDVPGGPQASDLRKDQASPPAKISRYEDVD